jgi:hypothetical protein
MKPLAGENLYISQLLYRGKKVYAIEISAGDTERGDREGGGRMMFRIRRPLGGLMGFF